MPAAPRLVLLPLLLAVLASACGGPGLCERKARFLTGRCAGSGVAVSVDPYCEKKIERCSPGQRAQMEGYVSCLEAAGECSLDAMRACQDQYPGGVNLVCS